MSSLRMKQHLESQVQSVISQRIVDIHFNHHISVARKFLISVKLVD